MSTKILSNLNISTTICSKTHQLTVHISLRSCEMVGMVGTGSDITSSNRDSETRRADTLSKVAVGKHEFPPSL